MTRVTPRLVAADQVVADTVRWLERAVIGLNLCPFAKSVHVKHQIRYVVHDSTAADALLDLLARELEGLAVADPAQVDTTLLMAPHMFDDFLEFNDFLDAADAVLRTHNLEGTLQIASFHPQFQFAGTAPDDISNFSNRSPHPTLHLIREASIDRAVEAFPDAEMIYERNIETLDKLGHEGWAALFPLPRKSERAFRDGSPPRHLQSRLEGGPSVLADFQPIRAGRTRTLRQHAHRSSALARKRWAPARVAKCFRR